MRDSIVNYLFLPIELQSSEKGKINLEHWDTFLIAVIKILQPGMNIQSAPMHPVQGTSNYH